MKKITVNEIGLGAAIQLYLESKGYNVHKIELKYDLTNKVYSAEAMVDGD